LALLCLRTFCSFFKKIPGFIHSRVNSINRCPFVAWRCGCSLSHAATACYPLLSARAPQDVSLLERVPWDIVILDEAHLLANTTSQVATTLVLGRAPLARTLLWAWAAPQDVLFAVCLYKCFSIYSRVIVLSLCHLCIWPHRPTINPPSPSTNLHRQPHRTVSINLTI